MSELFFFFGLFFYMVWLMVVLDRCDRHSTSEDGDTATFVLMIIFLALFIAGAISSAEVDQ